MKRLLLIILLLTCATLITVSSVASTDNYKYTETEEYSIEFTDKTGFFIKNPVGSISAQAWSESRIKITAVKRAKKEKILDEIEIVIKESKIGAEVRSVHPEKEAPDWVVNYSLKIPAGTHLEIGQGVGEVYLTDYSGSASVDLGTGEVRIDRLVGANLLVDIGVGGLEMADINCQSVQANVGIGNLSVELMPDASYTVSAAVGLGNITFGNFPGMELNKEGFIGKSARAVLGSGAGSLQLDVGVGDIFVKPMKSV